MTFDFDSHAECPNGPAEGIDMNRDCNANRALLIAEGKRLQAEVADLREALRLSREQTEVVSADRRSIINRSGADNARLAEQATDLIVEKNGLRDHVFVPGDPEYGWELQCRVAMRVPEAGLWVRANCGAPPEAHPPTSDPIHSDCCVARTVGTGCDCWASRAALAGKGEG
jgi:hypothetical protein